MQSGNKPSDQDTRKRKLANRDDFTLNKSFLTYYEVGLIGPDEWDAFCSSLKQELPVSFRYSSIESYASQIMPYTDKFIEELAGAITKIPWFDKGYEIKMNKKSLKNMEPYDNFRKFLMNATELGFLSRQEAVSMIPPLLLDVKPHHKILDMCAAPGSKTLQLIEFIHRNGLVTYCEQQGEIKLPSGFVIANDENKSRCFTLIHQTKRIPSPNYIVTSHDASLYPDLLLNKETRERLLFDRILCDVPCSGDGTIRKNVNASKFWKTTVAQGLQKLQCQILKRGIELLNPGGRLVYSTCSMNPIENEAVVLYALKTFSDQIKLIDTSDILPNLKSKPGIIPCLLKNSLSPEEISNANIHYCHRIYPHLQDTGGFFIACFERNPNISMRTTIGNSKIKENQPDESQALQKTLHVVKGGICVSNIGTDDPQLQDFYGITKIPDGLQAIGRSDNKSEKNLIYFTTNTLAQLVENNKEKLRVLSLGVRAIVKSHLKSYVGALSPNCDYRIVHEVLYIFQNKINKRIFIIDPKLFYELLIKDEIEKNDLTNTEYHNPEFIALADTLLNQLNQTSNGSIVFKVSTMAANNNHINGNLQKVSNVSLIRRTAYIAGYHSNRFIRILIKKEVRLHYLQVLGIKIDKAERIVDKKPSTKNSG